MDYEEQDLDLIGPGSIEPGDDSFFDPPSRHLDVHFSFKDLLHGFCLWCASSLIISLVGYVIFEAVMR
jgi:hypothetical protein